MLTRNFTDEMPKSQVKLNICPKLFCSLCNLNIPTKDSSSCFNLANSTFHLEVLPCWLFE